MQAFSSIAVVNGKPTMSAELMLALIYAKIPSAQIVYKETSDQACVIQASRTGANSSEFKFTIEDAKRAQLLNKATWQQYPSAMLRARCISAMARAMFPDAIMGVSYTPEELGAELSEEGEVIEIKQQGRHIPAAEEGEQSPTHPKAPPPSPTLNNPTPEQKRILDAMKPYEWTGKQVAEYISARFGKSTFSQLTPDELEIAVSNVEKTKYETAMQMAQIYVHAREEEKEGEEFTQ
jgi:hypothetical protein